MKIPAHIDVDLSVEERDFCLGALSICQNYSYAEQDDLVAGVLIYLLESYLRLCTAMDRNSDLSDKGSAEAFAQAHQEPPLLPPYLMDIAARAMRRLTFQDSAKLISWSETPIVVCRKRGAS